VFKKIVIIFKDNWENIIPVMIAIPLLVADMLGSELFPDGSIESMTLAMLIAIAISQVKNNHGNSLLNKLDTSMVKIDDIFTLSKGNVTIIKPKDEPNIWKNFRGRFYAINAPWALEDNSNVSSDEMIDGYIDTYDNDDFVGVTYVFYTNGPKGYYYPNALKKFHDFSLKVKEKSENVYNKIDVIVVDDKPAPAFSFFIGKKGGEVLGESGKKTSSLIPYCILYIGEEPFTSVKGVPSLAMLSINEPLNDKLNDYVDNIRSSYEIYSLDDFIRCKSEDIAS
jgi:hypothetical protein